MDTKDWLALCEQTAARRCSAAQFAVTDFVMNFRGRMIDEEYCDGLERLRARLEREEARHKFWLRLRHLDAGKLIN